MQPEAWGAAGHTGVKGPLHVPEHLSQTQVVGLEALGSATQVPSVRSIWCFNASHARLLCSFLPGDSGKGAGAMGEVSSPPQKLWESRKEMG